MKTYFLKVIGGPRDGCKYYDGFDPKPGRRVFLGESHHVGRGESGHYEIAADGRSVVWKGGR